LDSGNPWGMRHFQAGKCHTARDNRRQKGSLTERSKSQRRQEEKDSLLTLRFPTTCGTGMMSQAQLLLYKRYLTSALTTPRAHSHHKRESSPCHGESHTVAVGGPQFGGSGRFHPKKRLLCTDATQPCLKGNSVTTGSMQTMPGPSSHFSTERTSYKPEQNFKIQPKDYRPRHRLDIPRAEQVLRLGQKALDRHPTKSAAIGGQAAGVAAGVTSGDAALQATHRKRHPGLLEWGDAYVHFLDEAVSNRIDTTNTGHSYFGELWAHKRYH